MLPLLLESYKSVGSRAVLNIPGKLSLANHFQAVVLETEAPEPLYALTYLATVSDDPLSALSRFQESKLFYAH